MAYVIIVNENLRLHATGAESNNGKDLKAMSKRTLTMMVAMLTALLIATTGTLAYLTDTDGAVNVMTIGNVDIEQLEYERVENGDTPDKIQEFTQNKPLLPAVYQAGNVEWGDQQSWGQLESEAGNPAPGSNQLFGDSVQNVVDKFVFVENTGKTPTYVRTWFAFEQGDLTADEFEKLIITNRDTDHWSWETVAADVVIDGNKYVVAVATYTGNSGARQHHLPQPSAVLSASHRYQRGSESSGRQRYRRLRSADLLSGHSGHRL